MPQITFPEQAQHRVKRQPSRERNKASSETQQIRKSPHTNYETNMLTLLKEIHHELEISFRDRKNIKGSRENLKRHQIKQLEIKTKQELKWKASWTVFIADCPQQKRQLVMQKADEKKQRQRETNVGKSEREKNRTGSLEGEVPTHFEVQKFQEGKWVEASLKRQGWGCPRIKQIHGFRKPSESWAG